MTDGGPGGPSSAVLDRLPVLLCDRAGTTVYATPAVSRLAGVEPTGPTLPVERLVHPDDAVAVAAAFLEALETGTETRVSFRRRGDPRERSLLATFTPLPEEPPTGAEEAAGPDRADGASGPVSAVLVRLCEVSAAHRLYEALDALWNPAEGVLAADSRAGVLREIVERTRSVDSLVLRFYLRDDTSAVLHPVPGEAAATDGVPAAVRETDRTGRVTVLDDAARESVATGEPPPAAAVALPIGHHGVLVAGIGRSVDRSPTLSRGLRLLAATVALSLDRLDLNRRVARSATELERVRTGADRFADVVRAVRGAVRRAVEAPSAGAVHRAVCEELATLAPVAFVWYGSFDPDGMSVVPEASAGNGRSYLDRVGFEVEGPGPSPPVAEAVRTREVVSVPDVAAGDRTGDWWREALSAGLRSVLAAPVTDGETVRGVLAVYGREATALDGALRDGLDHLSRVMVHVLDALEVRAVALGNTTVELLLSIPAAESPLARLAAAADCTVEVESATPTPDGRTRIYFLTDAPSETVRAAADRVEAVGEVTRLGEREDGVVYGAVVSGRTVATTVASLGAVLVDTWTDGESVRATVALPRSADVREFVESVRGVYPDTELLARRARDRPVEVGDGDRTEFERQLTDRQREVLHAAYFGGYFEWPRDLSGSEIAATLGVSQPTFARHLRIAERTILSLLFENGD